MEFYFSPFDFFFISGDFNNKRNSNSYIFKFSEDSIK